MKTVPTFLATLDMSLHSPGCCVWDARESIEVQILVERMLARAKGESNYYPCQSDDSTIARMITNYSHPIHVHVHMQAQRVRETKLVASTTVYRTLVWSDLLPQETLQEKRKREAAQRKYELALLKVQTTQPDLNGEPSKRKKSKKQLVMPVAPIVPCKPPVTLLGADHCTVALHTHIHPEWVTYVEQYNSPSQRYRRIADHMVCNILDSYRVQSQHRRVFIEDYAYHMSTKKGSSITEICEAGGAVRAALDRSEWRVSTTPITTIKKVFTGNGAANKWQMWARFRDWMKMDWFAHLGWDKHHPDMYRASQRATVEHGIDETSAAHHITMSLPTVSKKRKRDLPFPSTDTSMEYESLEVVQGETTKVVMNDASHDDSNTSAIDVPKPIEDAVDAFAQLCTVLSTYC